MGDDGVENYRVGDVSVAEGARRTRRLSVWSVGVNPVALMRLMSSRLEAGRGATGPLRLLEHPVANHVEAQIGGHPLQRLLKHQREGRRHYRPTGTVLAQLQLILSGHASARAQPATAAPTRSHHEPIRYAPCSPPAGPVCA